MVENCTENGLGPAVIFSSDCAYTGLIDTHTLMHLTERILPHVQAEAG